MVRIGIDPDVEKSGFAYMVNGKLIALCNLPFFRLCTELETCAQGTSDLFLVTIEAGWLIKKSNWHPAQGKGIRDKIAKNVGENHAAGKLIARWCYERDIPYELIPPRGKVKSARFKRLTGWDGRTNQDMRDAAMLIWGRQ